MQDDIILTLLDAFDRVYGHYMSAIRLLTYTATECCVAGRHGFSSSRHFQRPLHQHDLVRA